VARAKRPSLVVIAGPNGAGKPTLAPVLLDAALWEQVLREANRGA
jgi:ABC-type Mn2+/Zn2+ transport system ATPase subunit